MVPPYAAAPLAIGPGAGPAPGYGPIPMDGPIPYDDDAATGVDGPIPYDDAATGVDGPIPYDDDAATGVDGPLPANTAAPRTSWGMPPPIRPLPPPLALALVGYGLLPATGLGEADGPSPAKPTDAANGVGRPLMTSSSPLLPPPPALTLAGGPEEDPSPPGLYAIDSAGKRALRCQSAASRIAPPSLTPHGICT